MLAGHSAGAHLAASYQSSGEAVRLADAMIGVSGLFDLLPLKSTAMLESLNLQVSELHAASPLFASPPASGQVLVAVGGEEPAEFEWQSARLASAWQPRQPQVMIVPGRSHFSVIEALGEPEYALFQQALRYFL